MMEENVMLKEKEVLLTQYILITKTMLPSVTKGAVDDFLELLEEREACISKMSKLDEEAGKVLMNEKMRAQLEDILPIEKRIQALLQQMLSKLGQQVRSAKNETFLTKQYEDTMQVSRGIFYDKKK
jgi:replicative superfamily II helicase